jgi:hypothetical protein
MHINVTITVQSFIFTSSQHVTELTVFILLKLLHCAEYQLLASHAF